MQNFSFEIPKEKWNIVSEVGLPQGDDGMWCLLVFDYFHNENYEYGFGGLRDDNTFYVNFGCGGMVSDADSVVAWVSLFNPDDGFLKVE